MPTPKEPRNPGRSLIRLSIIVYSSVLVVTALAVVAWYVYQPPEQIPGMIYIPAGTFLFGSDRLPVKLKAFYIDATEVTNTQYGDYCRATGCAVSGSPNLPVVDITVDQARRYAHWAHKRLPSALEWERAARGLEGAPYPWGDFPDPKLANVADNPALKTHELMAVRTFPGYPAFQMIGNAGEMVEGDAKPDPNDAAKFASLLKPPLKEDEPWVFIRGGSFLEKLMPISQEQMVPGRYSAMDIGFRCAKDP